MLARDPALVVLAFALGIALLFVARSTGRAWMRRRAIRARVRRAGEGESRAKGALEALGYEVLGAQVATEYALHVDGEPVTVGLRADYLVARGGGTYVVEVKTGAVAPQITTPATRRQLLEYRIAFAVDGVLLFDAETSRLRTITFPRIDAAPPKRRRFALVIAAAMIVAAAIALLRRSTL